MEYLTVKEIASKYKVSTKTIRNWVKKGMPSIKVGCVLRFDINAVDEWVKG